MTILLDNISADATSAIFESKGGIAMVNVRATIFGGGTVTLEVASIQDTSARFLPLTNGVFTTDASVKIDYLPSGLRLRAVLTGSTGASNVFVDILQ